MEIGYCSSATLVFTQKIETYVVLELQPSLKPIGRDCDVVAVRVHLNQLEVVAIKIPINEIIIGLEQ